MNETLDLKLLDIDSPARTTEAANTCFELILVSSNFKFIDASVEKGDISDHWGILWVTRESNQASNEVIQRRPLQYLNDADITCRVLL